MGSAMCSLWPDTASSRPPRAPPRGATPIVKARASGRARPCCKPWSGAVCVCWMLGPARGLKCARCLRNVLERPTADGSSQEHPKACIGCIGACCVGEIILGHLDTWFSLCLVLLRPLPTYNQTYNIQCTCADGLQCW